MYIHNTYLKMKKQPYKILSDLPAMSGRNPSQTGTASVPAFIRSEAPALYRRYGYADHGMQPDGQAGDAASQRPLSRREIGDMIDGRLSELRVYVLESDITQAQQSVKSIVELSSF